MRNDIDAGLAHQQEQEQREYLLGNGMKQIASALVNAQKEFSPALKTSTNPHFKNRYADLSSCIDAVMDALNANGIALIQTTHESQVGVIVETVFIHESGETFSGGRLQFPASKQDAQGYMSALTYARRGSLMAACGIAPADDDGEAASKPKPAKTLNIDVALQTLNASLDIDALKDSFKSLWTLATHEQREELKQSYDTLKLSFEKESA
jgi:hypothetical protein